MRKYLLLLLVSIIFVSSCAQGDSRKAQFQDYHQGSEGLRMRFLPQAPPARIFDQDPSAFNVQVELQNRGTFEVRGSDLLLTLGGFDRQIIPVPQHPQNHFSIDLQGRSPVFPEGGIDIAQWRVPGRINLPDNTDLYTPRIKVTACYRYQTQAAPVICLDPTPYSTVSQDDICSVNEVTISAGQGAPVAVTRVDPTIFAPSSGKVAQFKIYVQNVGGGKVLSPDSGVLSRCASGDLIASDENKVTVEARIGSRALECNPRTVTLYQGNAGFTHCTLRGFDSDAAYTTPLEIDLNYIYRQSIFNTVQIARTPGS